MSLIKFRLLSLLACFCACSAASAHAADVCPAHPGTSLRHAVVFDGPPQELDTLIPDQAGRRSGYWQLGYVYDAGRSVWIQCEYADGSKVDEKFAKRISRCDYTLDAAQIVAMKCR